MKTLKRLGIPILLVVSGLLLVATIFGVARFRSHVDEFNNHVRNKNAVAAQEKLDDLRFYYRNVGRVPVLNWLAGKTVFKEAPLYEAVVHMRKFDFESMRDELEGIEDWRAEQMLGIAEFTEGRNMYQSGESGDTIDSYVERARVHFEKALRMGPRDNFANVWNYDLMDDETAEKAMQQSQSEGRKQLRYQPGEGEEGREMEEIEGLDLQNNAGRNEGKDYTP